METILLRVAKITSLTIHLPLDRISRLLQLLAPSGPSVGELHVVSEVLSMPSPGEQTAHELWQNLPSLRQLFVSEYPIPLDQLNAQNLVHLALDETGRRQSVALQSILNMLRGCPRLETLFISESCSDYKNPISDHSLVSLSHLRSIELTMFGVESDLVAHLQFPPNVAVGFRMLP